MMLVLVTYDVSTVDASGKSRLRKVSKGCVTKYSISYGKMVVSDVCSMLNWRRRWVFP